MSSKKNSGKLDLNKETVRQLVDLSQVRGGEGQEEAAIVVVTRNTGKGGSTSWVMCCCKNA